MGIMAIILVTAGTYQEFTIPFWVMLSCAVAISAGLSLGGWSIVKTVGTKIYKLKPMLSFNAQMSAALVIMTASSLGSPVSTSQIVSSSIMGTGAGERANAVNWKTVKDIVLSWLITIPSAALIAIMISVLLKALFK
jgi:PiT family inorganic phosphate transporter